MDSILLEPARFGVTQPFDLISITPPYEEVVYAELVDQLVRSPVLGEDTLVIIEYPVELGCFPPPSATPDSSSACATADTAAPSSGCTSTARAARSTCRRSPRSLSLWDEE